jgi:hypothetical protein
MKQMRSRVIAHGRQAKVSIHDSINFVAHAQLMFSNNLMRPHTLNRRIASRNIGNNGVVIGRVKPSPVANLPTGFGIERRVIKNDLARLASLEFPRTLPVFDDRQNSSSIGAGLPVPFENGFWKLLICGIRSLLGCAFPRGTGAGLFLAPSLFKTLKIEVNSDITRDICHEVERKPEGLENVEGFCPWKNNLKASPPEFFKLSEIFCEELIGRSWFVGIE